MRKLIQKTLICLMALGVCVAFNACKEDMLDFKADVSYPTEGSEGAFLVEAWANDYTIEITSTDAWTVSTESRFVTLNTTGGNGNGTISFSVQANQSEQRKYAYLNIEFPGHEDQTKSIEIEQKWEGDYDDNADILQTSNRIYAVGYSYDATGEYASPNSVRKEIFDTKRMIEDGKLVTGPTQVKLVDNTITGSSISEMTNALAVKADVKGGFGKFKSEANASFDMNHAKNSNYEYAITYFDLVTRTATLDVGVEDLIIKYMTDDAYAAINGTDIPGRKGTMRPTPYPSTNEGFKKLIETYGTHVVVNAQLGGRVRYSMEVDVSKITSSYDVGAFAKASYNGAFVSGGGSVDEKFKQSYENNRKNITLRLSVLGGDQQKALALGDAAKGGFSKENLSAWLESVKDDNMTLMGFDNKSLIPLYEVVDQYEYPERYKKLKAYMEGDDIAADFSSYDCGNVVKCKVERYNASKKYATDVEDIKVGGQYVGQICHEYIPNIDRDKRVTVVYPVINNVPRYNMGFYVGDEYHKPARVSWDGTNVTVKEYPDLDFGTGHEISLYLRGASVSPTLAPETEALIGERTGAYLSAYRNETSSYSYPLVKIFNNLWTREDFQSQMKGDGNRVNPNDMIYFNGTGKLYLKHSVASDQNYPPAGWRVASSSDYKNIQSKLTANGVNEIGKAFCPNGVLGYDAELKGWLDNGHNPWDIYRGGDEQTEYLTSDRHHVRIRKDGTFAVESGVADSWYMSVRLIKK